MTNIRYVEVMFGVTLGNCFCVAHPLQYSAMYTWTQLATAFFPKTCPDIEYDQFRGESARLCVILGSYQINPFLAPPGALEIGLSLKT